ncbi:hypothetical protein BMS3Abin05_00765 [bacterium BMS3Abin05]|nr:hypothetical protein BMS3Abin05_00765 [bacterium BMS3Abin05]GBE26169.1 hypothetical protein BMS3Bbin03_00080 [bacterium BMS3Bbin03]
MKNLHIPFLIKNQLPVIEKDNLYFDLEEACKSHQCPVCLLLGKREKRYIDSIFYENVNDPGLRNKFRRAGGLCKSHTKLFLEIGDMLGLTIIAKDLLLQFIENPKAAAGAAECPLCLDYRESERRMIRAFARDLTIEEFWKALDKSVGLCREHFRAILEILSSKTLQTRLIAFEKEKLQTQLVHLNSFIRKNDYRFQEEKITAEESRAIRLVWRFLRKEKPQR